MGNELRESAPRMHEGEPLLIGRYQLAAQLARGGLATVYLGRLMGDGGLSRTVAVKRLHAQFRTDGDVTTMFLDEARVALRVRHPNVVHAVDVVLHEDELFIVMEYVEGASLSQVLRNVGKVHGEVPVDIAAGIVSNVLHGLHAAHTTRDERGTALDIVHRDVSPQNILVGTDGIARVLDFGIAKTVTQAHVTRANEVKGKLTYMAPEQILGTPVTHQADIFAMGIILWETLTGHRLFYGDNDGAIVRSILENPIPPPSEINRAVSADLDAIVLRALEREPSRRFATAEEMAARIEQVTPVASARSIGRWVRENADAELRARAELVARVEGNFSGVPAAEDTPRSRIYKTNRLPPGEVEPAVLAQAFAARDAQHRGPASRGWSRTLVPLFFFALICAVGFGVWRRNARLASAPSSVAAADESAVSVPPLIVPTTATASSAAALDEAVPTPASSSSTAAPVRPGRSANGPVRPPARPAPTGNRYTRF